MEEWYGVGVGASVIALRWIVRGISCSGDGPWWLSVRAPSMPPPSSGRWLVVECLFGLLLSRLVDWLSFPAAAAARLSSPWSFGLSALALWAVGSPFGSSLPWRRVPPASLSRAPSSTWLWVVRCPCLPRRLFIRRVRPGGRFSAAVILPVCRPACFFFWTHRCGGPLSRR